MKTAIEHMEWFHSQQVGMRDRAVEDMRRLESELTKAKQFLHQLDTTIADAVSALVHLKTNPADIKPVIEEVKEEVKKAEDKTLSLKK